MKTQKTLHEAMSDIIRKLGPMRAKQLAWIINNSKVYIKKDSSELKTSQIYARVNKYPDMFEISEDKLVKLK